MLIHVNVLFPSQWESLIKNEPNVLNNTGIKTVDCLKCSAQSLPDSLGVSIMDDKTKWNIHQILPPHCFMKLFDIT